MGFTALIDTSTITRALNEQGYKYDFKNKKWVLTRKSNPTKKPTEIVDLNKKLDETIQNINLNTELVEEIFKSTKKSVDIVKKNNEQNINLFNNYDIILNTLKEKLLTFENRLVELENNQIIFNDFKKIISQYENVISNDIVDYAKLYRDSINQERMKNSTFSFENAVFSVRIQRHIIEQLETYCSKYNVNKGQLIGGLFTLYFEN